LSWDRKNKPDKNIRPQKKHKKTQSKLYDVFVSFVLFLWLITAGLARFSDFIGKPAMPVRVLARVKILLSSLGIKRQLAPHHALSIQLQEVPPWLRRSYMSSP
jgi:hypothetical protein